ncbi:MAG: histidinol-phosphate transaminase [Firmicutes bacterium HGW-Firmicutes-12]|jgi:histidinol-phosphate aminotransferase|nr:MAG: histidinol-phosphate transaminase [Firmicutes bacterium HGW-Firmicutes-12]
MNKFWNPLLNELEPYAPGEQPQDKKYIKLNTNENPYPPSPRAIAAIQQATNERLRFYPDPECLELRKAIAKYHKILPEQVFVGNGSDEVLAFAYLSFFNPEKTILFPDITYSFYPVYANLFRNKYKLIALNDDFTLPVEKFLQENGGIIFPNPNAPTGIFLPLKNIEGIVKHNSNSIVILDEAYIAFGGESADKLIDKYSNLLVIRTLSKSHSLAGLRGGYAIGDTGLIEGLNRVKNSINSYTLDRLALAGATEAILDREYLEKTTAKIISTREKVTLSLIKLDFMVLPSKANFLFITHPSLPANEIYQLLREKGILVRYFNKPRINNFLRVTIGSDQEMDNFLHTINEMVNIHP